MKDRKRRQERQQHLRREKGERGRTEEKEGQVIKSDSIRTRRTGEQNRQRETQIDRYTKNQRGRETYTHTEI